MDLDLGGALGSPAAPANNVDDVHRIAALMTEMQRGIDMLTEILGAHDARMKALEVEIRRLKARTDAPPRSAILRPN